MEFTDLDVFSERTREWQGVGGPPQWVAAWERTRELLSPRWADGRFRPSEHYTDTGEYADGAAGLATAIYIVARERGIPVSEVSRADVAQFKRQDGEYLDEVLPRWEARLRALGHTPDDPEPTDPVALRWQVLKIDRPEPRHIEDYSWVRQGPGVLEGLGYVLSPHMDLSF